MKAPDLSDVRRGFADHLRELGAIRSPAVLAAFAAVPRESFLGPGPWKLLVPPEFTRYRTTPDDDPRHLYQNVLVAIDESRRLNNGEPAALAIWIEALGLAPGESVVHLGCGVGYYSAILAEVVGPTGRVIGLEVDPELAERARRNLRRWAQVSVTVDAGTAIAPDSADAIFVNAGATHPSRAWLHALRPGGRLLVPLTVAMKGMNAGVGYMLRVRRTSGEHEAAFVSPVGIFHCVGARAEAYEDLLRRAFERGGQEEVRSLGLAPHAPNDSCWLHAPDFCLSRRPAAE